MASSMMHVYVGYYLSRRLALSDPGAFYLGCVAPDSVNVDGFAPKQTRWAAHLRAAELTRWSGNVARFYAENRSGAPHPDLLLGYAVHALTDIAWDERYHDAVWEGMKRKKQPSIMGEAPGWEDCFRYDFDQLRAPWWLEEVRPLFARATAADVNTISAALLGRYQRYLLEDYAATIPEGGPHMVTPELVAALAELVWEKCAVLRQ